jgi:two-component system, NtrC family, sensor kinase
MHIEEPTTQKFEVDASKRCAQVSSEQGQLSAPQTLENCEQLRKSCHGDASSWQSLQSALRMALAKEDFLVRLREIVDCVNCIDREISLKDILQASVREVRKFFHSDRVAIYQIFPESGIVAVDSDSSVFERVDNPSGLVTPILLPHYGENQSSEQMMMWGMVIMNDSRSSRTWETREIDILKQVSREIAIAIEKSQLRQQIKIAETQAKQALEKIATTQEETTQFQTQLLQKAKLSTLGQLIVDLVNEIHNPVNFIFSSIHKTSQYAEDLIHLLEQYQHSYPIPPTAIASPQKLTNVDFAKTDFLKSLWSMRAGADRLQDTVSALYKFSQFDNVHLKKTDLHDGLNSILTILQHRLKEKAQQPGIQVIKKFGDIPLVECFPGEVNQAFLNILTNAIEALEERMQHDYSFTPKIWISTEIVNSHLSLISSNGIKATTQQNSQKQKILIRISDNGKGILPHIQRHIFEPFFSTKPVGKGNGLGLAISRKIIVEKHRGKLGCKSQLGKGSEFFIEINIGAKQYADIRKHASF